MSDFLFLCYNKDSNMEEFMKKNNIFIILSVVIILLLGCLFVPSLLDKDKDLNDKHLPERVIIKQYEAGTSELIKEVVIDSKDEIEELSKYVSKLKPLSEHEMVNLALLQEIEIIYDDSISIGVQLEEEGYCYYKNTNENISSLSKMPKGLINWIKDNIK
jgi:hypothetical protein